MKACGCSRPSALQGAHVRAQPAGRPGRRRTKAQRGCSRVLCVYRARLHPLPYSLCQLGADGVGVGLGFLWGRLARRRWRLWRLQAQRLHAQGGPQPANETCVGASEPPVQAKHAAKPSSTRDSTAAGHKISPCAPVGLFYAQGHIVAVARHVYWTSRAFCTEARARQGSVIYGATLMYLQRSWQRRMVLIYLSTFEGGQAAQPILSSPLHTCCTPPHAIQSHVQCAQPSGM